MLQDMPEDTPEWHRFRALLTGVPSVEVDEKFHLREGHRV